MIIESKKIWKTIAKKMDCDSLSFYGSGTKQKTDYHYDNNRLMK